MKKLHRYKINETYLYLVKTVVETGRALQCIGDNIFDLYSLLIGI